jgi:hypothetical protein
MFCEETDSFKGVDDGVTWGKCVFESIHSRNDVSGTRELTEPHSNSPVKTLAPAQTRAHCGPPVSLGGMGR